ncbi:MAG: hypothetical protein JO122_09945 [Acetobacteraceae bacterium]|nr:hypothetical protein [Acetobacteraceae bacterium]
MLDLNKSAVETWATAHGPPCLGLLRGPEVIALDDYPSVSARLIRLGQMLERVAGARAARELGEPNVLAALQTLLPLLSDNRLLRLIDWLAETRAGTSAPVSALLLTDDAEEAPPGSAAYLRKRFAWQQRVDLLLSVLGRAKALETLLEEEGTHT